MSTYTSIKQTSLFRLQSQMAEHRLVQAFRQTGWLGHSSAPRRAAGQVTRIRHWQDGGFVSLPLAA